MCKCECECECECGCECECECECACGCKCMCECTEPRQRALLLRRSRLQGRGELDHEDRQKTAAAGVFRCKSIAQFALGESAPQICKPRKNVPRQKRALKVLEPQNVRVLQQLSKLTFQKDKTRDGILSWTFWKVFFTYCSDVGCERARGLRPPHLPLSKEYPPYVMHGDTKAKPGP